MKYTLRYISHDAFFYPVRIRAHHDGGVGPHPVGSYLVLYVTSKLGEALFYDTAEEAEKLTKADLAFTMPDNNIFTLLGIIRVSEKKIFQLRLQDK